MFVPSRIRGRFLPGAILGLVLGLVAPSTYAMTGMVNVDWGSGVGQTLITSTGADITDLSGFTFEIGTFGTYDPTTLDFDNWNKHWTGLDTSIVVESPPTSGIYLYGGSTTFDHTHPFAAHAGEQIYVWGYNNFNQPGDAEWALYTRTGSPEPWLVPSISPGQTSLDVDYFLSGADTAVKGMIQGTTFDLQTMSLTLIPEPSRVVLTTLGLMAGLLRRRRSA